MSISYIFPTQVVHFTQVSFEEKVAHAGPRGRLVQKTLAVLVVVLEGSVIQNFAKLAMHGEISLVLLSICRI